jgi:hypothetical protein
MPIVEAWTEEVGKMMWKDEPLRLHSGALTPLLCRALTVGAAVFVLVRATSVIADAMVTATPMREPGLWQMTFMPATGQPNPLAALPSDVKIVRCVGLEQEIADIEKAQHESGCQMKYAGSGNRYTYDGACARPDGSKFTDHGVMTVGDWAPGQKGKQMRSYDKEVNVHHISSNSDQHIKEHWSWLSACPAGVQAGDSGIMQNGIFKRLHSGAQ